VVTFSGGSEESAVTGMLTTARSYPLTTARDPAHEVVAAAAGPVFDGGGSIHCPPDGRAPFVMRD
jgi:hypothetical protein